MESLVREVLTVKTIGTLQPGTVFAKGTIMDGGRKGVVLQGSGRPLRWVAKTGWNLDWAIYCLTSDKSYEEVEHTGDKVVIEAAIKELVPCSGHAFERYRY